MLSPLLAILDFYGLRRGIRVSQEKGNIVGCRVLRKIQATHPIFVDDFHCAREAKIAEWREFHQIISNSGKASGLIKNKKKLKLISNNLEEAIT